MMAVAPRSITSGNNHVTRGTATGVVNDLYRHGRANASFTLDLNFEPVRIEAHRSPLYRPDHVLVVRADCPLSCSCPSGPFHHELVFDQKSHLEEREPHDQDEGKDQGELNRRRGPFPVPLDSSASRRHLADLVDDLVEEGGQLAR